MSHLLWLLMLRVVWLLLCLHHWTRLVRVWRLLVRVWVCGGLLGVVLRIGFHTGWKKRVEGGHGAVRVKGLLVYGCNRGRESRATAMALAAELILYAMTCQPILRPNRRCVLSSQRRHPRLTLGAFRKRGCDCLSAREAVSFRRARASKMRCSAGKRRRGDSGRGNGGRKQCLPLTAEESSTGEDRCSRDLKISNKLAIRRQASNTGTQESNWARTWSSTGARAKLHRTRT